MWTWDLPSRIKTTLIGVALVFAPVAWPAPSSPLDLTAVILGKKSVRISPQDYPMDALADFYALPEPTQAEFLELRKEKLAGLLKTLRGRIVEDADATEPQPGWLTQKALALVKSIDILLFRNAKLLTTPNKDVGTLYTAQVVTYWGLGNRVAGWGMELSLLRERTLEGTLKTTISLDKIHVLRAYVPVPVAAATFRAIRFNSLDFGPDEMENVNVDHLPLGPVTSTGKNHLGLGFGTGVAFPPAPVGSITGFTARRGQRKVLWSCERLLEDTRKN